MRTTIIATIAAIVANLSLAAVAEAKIPLGTKPAEVTIKGDDGGRVDGKPWSSSMIKGKVYAFFYVDPDEKDINEKMENALDEAKFPEDKYASIAVINMDATWLPNTFIASALEEKQKKFPRVTYVKDLSKVLVKKWSLKDDDYDILVFDKSGKVIFSHEGVMKDDNIKAMLDLIRKNLDAPAG